MLNFRKARILRKNNLEVAVSTAPFAACKRVQLLPPFFLGKQKIVRLKHTNGLSIDNSWYTRGLSNDVVDLFNETGQ